MRQRSLEVPSCAGLSHFASFKPRDVSGVRYTSLQRSAWSGNDLYSIRAALFVYDCKDVKMMAVTSKWVRMMPITKDLALLSLWLVDRSEDPGKQLRRRKTSEKHPILESLG